MCLAWCAAIARFGESERSNIRLALLYRNLFEIGTADKSAYFDELPYKVVLPSFKL